MQAKKSYGQHFLHRADLAERIALSVSNHDGYTDILEIGPGMGMLTQFLLKRYPHMFAVEADADMVAYLKTHYPQLEPHLLAEDFMKLNVNRIFGERSFGIVGNFPYNISSQIVISMLDNRQQVPELVGMFQLEMAERIIAPHGSKTFGTLSVLTQMYYEGSLLFEVDKSAFNPPPQVQSAVIQLRRRQTPLYTGSETLLRHVVKTVFQQRRKMLRNTMKSLVTNTDVLQEPFFQLRPEQLSLEQFVSLCELVEQDRKS